MSKKVKGFNVDDDIYNSLIQMIKKYKVDVSLSAYVNDQLKRLLGDLQVVEEALKDDKRFTVPISFIIDKIFGEREEMAFKGEEGLGKEDVILFELRDWQDDYESQRRRIPVVFVQMLKGGLYELSPDKRYLIEKETGKKYVAGRTRNDIIPVEK